MPVSSLSLSAEKLSGIMLMQGMIGNLPDPPAVLSFVARGLQDLPGVRASSHAALAPRPTCDDLVLPLETSDRSYGAFVLELGDPAAFAPYERHVQNLCFMVVVLLEERRQRADNAQYQQQLERRVAERTQQLVEEVAVRREAEEQAHVQRMRAEGYLAVAESLIVEIDMGGRIRVINPRACQILGRTEAEMIGRSWAEVALPAVAPRVTGALLVGGAEVPEYCENQIVDASGQRYDIAWHNVVLRDPGGPAGMLSSGQDITARKAAERALAAEKDRLAVTLRSIGDGVITTDLEGRIVLLNAVAERLTGWTQAEAAGQPLTACFRAVNEQTRAPRPTPVDTVAASNGVQERESTLLISRDGTECAIAQSAAPIHTSSGQCLGVVLVFRDVTERQRMLEVMQRTDRLDALGILAGGLAHDFNNLLSGIFGFVGLARMETQEPTVARNLGEALAALDRARGLTRQLLTFAKGGAPIRRLEHLSPLIRETVQFALSGSNVACQFDVADELWPCNCDTGQVAQVLDNLVINAVQAMPLGGSIDVVASNVLLSEQGILSLVCGPYVKITIQDRGVGIPAAMLDRIFDPFFTTKQKGNGLGLATCHSIVRRHEGCIQVASQPGEGSTFTVYLPAAGEGSVSDAQPVQSTHAGTGTILVMDDEPMVLNVTATMLEHLGYTVMTAASGEQALEIHRRETSLGRRIEAVLLDLTVPGAMGGKEAGETLRQLDPALPIFVFSGYAEDPMVADPSRYGFTASLCKPFTYEELVAMLSQHEPGLREAPSSR